MKTYKTKVSKFDYGERAKRYFNSASTAFFSAQAKAEARRAAIRKSRNALEELRKRATEGCAAMLEAPPESVTLHLNTTAGIQRLFLRIDQLLQGHTASLFTTDLEYPGVLALANEAWKGRMSIVEIARFIQRSAGLSDDRILTFLKAAFQFLVPDVVYISDVDRTYGRRLPLVPFFQFAKALNPRVVLIVDGAQALGHVSVGGDLLHMSDFYVTSGHKWLGGEPTIGIVRARHNWNLSDPGQSYSRQSGSAGTGDLPALASLTTALDEFRPSIPNTGRNQSSRPAELASYSNRLARSFVNQISGLNGVRHAGHSTGMVSIWSQREGLMAHVHEKLRRRFTLEYVCREPWSTGEGGEPSGQRYLVTPADWTDPAKEVPIMREIHLARDELGTTVPDGGLLRCCFHLFHDEGCINHLVKALVSEWHA